MEPFQKKAGNATCAASHAGLLVCRFPRETIPKAEIVVGKQGFSLVGL